MVRQDFHIDSADWDVTVFYPVSSLNVTRIICELRKAGCSNRNLQRAYSNLFAHKENTGMTFSNTSERKSIIVLGFASSADEYANSICHERRHLVTHIAQDLGLDPYGEEVCYLDGEVAGKMFRITKQLVCPTCLSKLRASLKHSS